MKCTALYSRQLLAHAQGLFILGFFFATIFFFMKTILLHCPSGSKKEMIHGSIQTSEKSSDDGQEKARGVQGFIDNTNVVPWHLGVIKGIIHEKKLTYDSVSDKGWKIGAQNGCFWFLNQR